GADYYMSFDNERVGELQAKALVDATNNSGKILMLNGAPDDPNAAQFKKGAHKVLDQSGLKIVGEYDNPDWSPGNAQQYTATQLGKINPHSLAGVYAANDGQAGGVIAALTGSGLSINELPPVTGQDAELAGIQHIADGEQYMTIYKPITTEAHTAAEVAVKLVNGKDVNAPKTYQGVKSFIFKPIVVTKDNIAETVVKDKFYSVDDICTKQYAAACKKIGLT
ncbi:MAG: substrate-binding domain-containing protein, partial [Nocardioidaceae bacterium]